MEGLYYKLSLIAYAVWETFFLLISSPLTNLLHINNIFCVLNEMKGHDTAMFGFEKKISSLLVARYHHYKISNTFRSLVMSLLSPC